MPSSHLILCRPLLLLPSIPPSTRVFSSESAFHMKWPKYWNFSLSISPSKEHPGLISFRMGWLDLLAVQGSLKGPLQHHSSKVSTLCIRWPKYWSFIFSIIPSKEIPRLSFFRMDWLDLLAVQGTHESSPTPHFKSINSLVLSFLHSLTLASRHDHWKNHSFD